MRFEGTMKVEELTDADEVELMNAVAFVLLSNPDFMEDAQTYAGETLVGKGLSALTGLPRAFAEELVTFVATRLARE
jgi:hypothetical protein